MTMAREGQAAVRLGDGRVLIMGGMVPFTGKCAMACIAPPTASVEVYDPGTGKFSPNGSLAEPLAGGEALLLNDGRVLVAGDPAGFAGLNTIEIYDTAKGTSVVVEPPADMKELPTNTAVVLLADGRVLIAGGSYDSGTTSSNVTLIFDPATGGFSHGPLMARPRQGAMATLLVDGRVLIVAGDDGYGGDAQDLAELIDLSHPLASSTFSVSPDRAASTLLSDGRVLVTGGVTYQVFDPTTARFTPVRPTSTPGSGPVAIRIQDGRVLFLGGADSNREATNTVEAFDPDSGTFQVIATGFPKITDFSATLLSDGEILIVGGSDENAMTAATWLLQP